jgi:Domain of unknown function (DUF4157)
MVIDSRTLVSREGAAMFAPKVAKAQTKVVEGSTGRRAQLCSEHATKGGSAIARKAPRGLAWDFSKIPLFPPTPIRGAIQAKLVVGQANDPLEQEANLVAEQVMRMPDPALRLTPAAQLRRKCADCEAEDENKVRLQPMAPAGAAPGEAPPIVHEVLRSPGQPLDATTRAFMEPRFGYDFSRVRVHTDAKAAKSAHDVNALAYTVGEHIVFGAAQHARKKIDGQRLLAHELTHTIQQSGGTRADSVVRRISVTVATEGTCADERKIAEAIPGALAMVRVALFDWFTKAGGRDLARIKMLLRANFLSDSNDTFDTVRDRLASMYTMLQEAMDGKVTFVCAPRTDQECGGRTGYVLPTEHHRIHICPPFFNLTLEGRRWMLVHETAHLAGASRLPESYWDFFGPISEDQCRLITGAGSTIEALGNADNYARLIWCLTKPAGTEATPP